MPFLYFSITLTKPTKLMKKTFAILLLALTLTSCNKNEIYREFENEISAQRWTESDVKTHEFEIQDEGKNYNVYIEISHVRGTEMSKFPIFFEMTKADGSKDSSTISMDFTKTECAGDVCDVKFLAKEKMSLGKGKYKISFSPKSKFGFVPNIIGVGLSIELAN